MKLTLKTLLGAAAVIVASTVSVHAETVLKWAHVYETSEPYHRQSVWAGDEIKKRTNGRYEVQDGLYLPLRARQGTQGSALLAGTVPSQAQTTAPARPAGPALSADPVLTLDGLPRPAAPPPETEAAARDSASVTAAEASAQAVEPLPASSSNTP